MPDLTQEGLAARGLRVKALEWKQAGGDIRAGDGYSAWGRLSHAPTAIYRKHDGWWLSVDCKTHPTLEAAKAAAQADYAARILAALEDTGEPALIREAEARVARIAAGLFPGGYYKNLEAIEAAALRKDEEPK